MFGLDGLDGLKLLRFKILWPNVDVRRQDFGLNDYLLAHCNVICRGPFR